MVKVIVAAIAVFVAFAVVSAKYKNSETKPQAYNVLYIVHIVLGALFTVAAAVHGFTHIQTAPAWMIATGATALATAVAQIAVGLILQKNKSKVLKVIHGILPIAIVLSVVAHVIVLKMM